MTPIKPITNKDTKDCFCNFCDNFDLLVPIYRYRIEMQGELLYPMCFYGKCRVNNLFMFANTHTSYCKHYKETIHDLLGVFDKKYMYDVTRNICIKNTLKK